MSALWLRFRNGPLVTLSWWWWHVSPSQAHARLDLVEADAAKANRKADFLAAKLASVLPDDLYPGETSPPCPMVDGRGFPQCPHRDTLAAELPEGDEEWLASVAAQLWPGDEYTDPPGGDR